MRDFYEWYLAAGLEVVNLDNAGDPMTDEPWAMSSHVFEREVIDYFAPLYGFDKSDVWGIVTHSGTYGNNHGIYFGANYLWAPPSKVLSTTWKPSMLCSTAIQRFPPSIAM